MCYFTVADFVFKNRLGTYFEILWYRLGTDIPAKYINIEKLRILGVTVELREKVRG